MGIVEARQHLNRAKKHLTKVQTASWEPQDPEGAVTWAFYAYENCVSALAERYGQKWEKHHRAKAELARKLHAQGLVSRDIGDELEELNTLRKDVAYDGPSPDLQERDLEDLAIALEQFIDEIDSRIGPSV